MTPKVSVIVPIYNIAKYLPKCLDALINQTLRDIEIICVNDGSKDNSAQIVQEYIQKDSRIRYIYQDNQGLAAARNTGIGTALAPYIMFCDPDDWYDKTMCQKMYDAITKNDVDFACCGTNVVYEADESLKESDDSYYCVNFSGIVPSNENLLEKTDVSSWDKIFKKSLIKEYAITFPSGYLYEDYCFFFKYLSVSKNAFYIQEKLHNYLRRCGSIMNATFRGSDRAIDHVKIMAQVYDFLKKNSLWDKWEKAFYNGFLGCFYFSYTHLPKDKKYQAFDVAIPFMKNFSQEKIDTLLSEDKKNFWHCILNKTCFPEPYVKKIKIGGITIIKIKQKKLKYTVLFLGLQIFSKKQKKNKEKFYVLYIPVFKRKIKNA